LKINLLKSPRRFDGAPQSLTTLRGSCCSTSNPLTLLSPPGKTSHRWGLRQTIRWEKNIDYGLEVIIMKIVT